MEIKLYNKLGNIQNMATKEARPEFVEKVRAKMNAENLSLRDLAKILGVTHPTVNELVNNSNMPSVTTCLALAKWLKQSDVSVMREVGLLPPETTPDDRVKGLQQKLLYLTEREDILVVEKLIDSLTSQPNKPLKNLKHRTSKG